MGESVVSDWLVQAVQPGRGHARRGVRIKALEAIVAIDRSSQSEPHIVITITTRPHTHSQQEQRQQRTAVSSFVTRLNDQCTIPRPQF